MYSVRRPDLGVEEEHAASTLRWLEVLHDVCDVQPTQCRLRAELSGAVLGQELVALRGQAVHPDPLLGEHGPLHTLNNEHLVGENRNLTVFWLPGLERCNHLRSLRLRDKVCNGGEHHSHLEVCGPAPFLRLVQEPELDGRVEGDAVGRVVVVAEEHHAGVLHKVDIVHVACGDGEPRSGPEVSVRDVDAEREGLLVVANEVVKGHVICQELWLLALQNLLHWGDEDGARGDGWGGFVAGGDHVAGAFYVARGTERAGSDHIGTAESQATQHPPGLESCMGGGGGGGEGGGVSGEGG